MAELTEKGKALKKWKNTREYRDNFDRIFGKKSPKDSDQSPDKSIVTSEGDQHDEVSKQSDS